MQGALFYGASSVGIMLSNKYLLTVYGFPSPTVLALSQFVCTVVVLFVSKNVLRKIDFPAVTVTNAMSVFPLPLFFLLNAVFGLAGTQAISIPMFAVLRRSNLLLTMVGEYWLLNYVYSRKIKLSIAVILGGSLLAACDDLAFDPWSYSLVFANNVFTSASGVYSKLKLTSSSSTTEQSKNTPPPLGRYGLTFFNALFSFPLLLAFLMVARPNDLIAAYEYPHWRSPDFLLLFASSSLLGTVLQFSIVYCTDVNSSLTTVVVGCLKNVLTTYFGMLAPGMDYVFSTANFTGVNVSIVGSLWYAYLQTAKPGAQSSSSSKLLPSTASGDADANEETEMLVHTKV